MPAQVEAGLAAPHIALHSHSRLPTITLGLLSGILLALAFPKFGHPAVAWVALVPWMIGLARCQAQRPGDPRQPVWSGLAMGATYFAGTLYWIPDVLITFGGLNPVLAVPVGALLVAYLAVFPLLASWLTAGVVRSYGLVGLWFAPIAWVTAEWLRGWVLTGFPWVTLGSSQMPWLPLVQAASLFGILSVTAHIVLVNAAVALVLLDRSRFVRSALTVALITLAMAGWGQWRIRGHDASPAGPRLKVALIQGNVRQDQKWDAESRTAIFERYLRLSRDGAMQGAELIIWPESATPFFFEEHVDGASIRALARETGTWFLFGSDQIERGPNARYFNAAYLVGPDGQTAGVYRKQHLVPFGEYVPFKRLLFFVAPLVEAVADFSPGTEPAVMRVNGHPLSTAICYEVIFSGLSRAAVNAGSQLLTTVTNDAWYGTTSAPWQHFDLAAVRAVEFGRYLVRSANTGVSGVVDPVGRVLARSRLFEADVIVRDVPLRDTRTLYSKIGDSFAWACAACCAVVTFGRRGRFRVHR